MRPDTSPATSSPLEAMTLAAVGGVLGILIGLGGAYGLAQVFDMPMHIPVTGTIVAFGFAVIVGVLFGVFPARKAARLRPIEALRFE